MLQWGHNRPHQVWQVGGGSSSLGMPCSVAPFLGGPGSSALNSARMALSPGKTSCLPPGPYREGAPSAPRPGSRNEQHPFPGPEGLRAALVRHGGPFGSKTSLHPQDELDDDRLTPNDYLAFKGWSSKIVKDYQLCLFQLLCAL